jgi:hypothetical protein
LQPFESTGKNLLSRIGYGRASRAGR